MVSEESVLETIKENIIDPEIGINIVDMGLIYGVDINDATVDITMTLTSPGMSCWWTDCQRRTARHTATGRRLKKSMLMWCGTRVGLLEMMS